MNNGISKRNSFNEGARPASTNTNTHCAGVCPLAAFPAMSTSFNASSFTGAGNISATRLNVVRACSNCPVANRFTARKYVEYGIS